MRRVDPCDPREQYVLRQRTASPSEVQVPRVPVRLHRARWRCVPSEIAAAATSSTSNSSANDSATLVLRRNHPRRDAHARPPASTQGAAPLRVERASPLRIRARSTSRPGAGASPSDAKSVVGTDFATYPASVTHIRTGCPTPRHERVLPVTLLRRPIGGYILGATRWRARHITTKADLCETSSPIRGPGTLPALDWADRAAAAVGRAQALRDFVEPATRLRSNGSLWPGVLHLRLAPRGHVALCLRLGRTSSVVSWQRRPSRTPRAPFRSPAPREPSSVLLV